MKRKLLALVAGLVVAIGTAFFAASDAQASFHCDEACNDEDPAQCEFNQYTFTVCVGGGAWIPCEEGACGPE